MILQEQITTLDREQTDWVTCPVCEQDHRPHRYDLKLCSECFLQAVGTKPKCRLCETREATEMKSPVTKLPQYCLQCLKREIKG